MSKWCNTCYRNELTGKWRACSQDCPVFGKDFGDIIKSVIANELNIEDKKEEMYSTHGYYINVWNSKHDVLILFNEPNEKPTDTEIGIIKGIVEEGVRQYSGCKTLDCIIQDAINCSKLRSVKHGVRVSITQLTD